jgi:uncharacterized protein
MVLGSNHFEIRSSKSEILRCVWRLLLLIGLCACDSTPRVIVEDQRGEKVSFEVEIADTSAKRAFGLKYRRDLRSDEGMLFIFPEEKVHTFWMKDTPLPLDMIFIDRDRRIVGIVHETQPFSTESRSVSAPSLYVLEVRGGVARKKGLGIGDTVSFQSIADHGRDR